MDNQHRKIEGYRELDEETIAKMNLIKEAGKQLGDLCQQLSDDPNVDKRWLAIGITELQKGGMALTRSVATPDFFF